MRAALRPNRARAATNSSKSIPSPVGGWNARDSVADMRENEALWLENYFPESSFCRLRGGFLSWGTGIGTGVVDSLITYTGLSTQKLFAAAGGKIYDVSSEGAGSEEATGFTSNRWQFENFGNAGGNYVFIVNGQDAPQKFDGTSWSSWSITGPTVANLVMVKSYKERIFVAEKNSLRFWYLPVNNVSGAMTSFDLAPYCSLGGSLQFIATWSRDAGDGSDDYIVFGTSEGEVIIYTGIDPSSASDWRLSAIYRMPEPVGYRCTVRVGSDLVILTTAGFIPLSKIMLLGLYVNRAAVSDKIEPAIQNATRVFGNNYGWQAIYYPEQDMGIFNIPIAEGNQQEQYVVNTKTGAWCKFTNLNANCWGLYNGNIYFGGNDGTVYKALTGTEDNGANIQAKGLPAFSYFGSRGKKKRFTLARPVMRSTGNLKVSSKVNVDFAQDFPDFPDNSNETSGTAWDEGDWDVSAWGGDFQVTKAWRTIAGSGLCASLAIATSTKFQEIEWLSTDWNYELGGVI